MKHYLLAGTSALALLVGAAGADATTFNFTGAVVDFTAAVTGTYDITAAGAQGGRGFAGRGLGALAGGDVVLAAGTVLDIAVGGAGGNGGSFFGSFTGGGGGGGGGGGSFLASYVANPDLVTGGADNGANSGNGYVTVELVPAAVPEPGSLSLVAAAFAGLGLIRRRRRG